jgi:uncharacterized protein YcgI (DUF1989 family)
MKNPKFLLCFVIFIFNACDICDSAAQKICDCLETKERNICKKNLNSASGQQFFSIARDEKVCEEVLNNCTCQEINDKNHQNCGRYRYDNIKN